jgi:hypothetical protein
MLLLAVLVGCTNNPKKPTYMGYLVTNQKFKIADDKTIYLPVTKAGPIPAENENYKVEIAGIITGPSKINPEKSVLIFAFSFTNKRGNSLKNVKIEQVYPSKSKVELINDNNPTFNENIWSENAMPLEINKYNVPWFYVKGDTTFIFKFTFLSIDGASTILYQPSSFPDQAKKMLREHHSN